MQKILTCIVCPLGCGIEVEIKDGKILSIKGNTCKKGKDYAEAECTFPTRTLTTTVRTDSGYMLPVKS